MLCASRLGRIRSCPFAGTPTRHWPPTTSCFSTKSSVERASEALWTPLCGTLSPSGHHGARLPDVRFRLQWNCTLHTRSFHSRCRKSILHPFDRLDGNHKSNSPTSFSAGAIAWFSQSSIEQDPAKPVLPPRSATSSPGRPTSQYKPAATRAPVRGGVASENILLARQQAEKTRQRLEQDKAEQERERQRKEAELRAQEMARQKEAEETARRAEEARRLAAEALERQRVRQAGALERQRRREEEARRVAAKRAEQQLLRREEEARERARLAEMERQQALDLIEDLQSQWPSLDSKGKDAVAQKLLRHPLAVSTLEKREDSVIYQELCTIWEEQQQQRAELARLQRLEEDLRQNKKLIGEELVNSLERLTLASESDKRTDKAQRLDAYNKITRSFQQLTEVELATHNDLREIIDFLTYTAKAQRDMVREANQRRNSAGASTVNHEEKAPIDQDQPNQKDLQETADLKRFTCIQMSRVMINSLQETRLLALATHNMRKIVVFRRFKIAAEGLLDLPKFKLRHALREAEEAWCRSHSNLRRAIELTLTTGLVPLEYTGSLTDEAREVLSIFPGFRLLADSRNRTVIVSNRDPRTSRSPEGKVAHSRLEASFEAWRSIQHQRKAVTRELRVLSIAHLRRLLAEGFLAQQKHCQMTFVISHSHGVLSTPLNVITHRRLTEHAFNKVVRLIRRILASGNLLTDPECSEAFAPARTQCHRLLGLLGKLRRLPAKESGLVPTRKGPRKAARLLIYEIGLAHRELTTLLYEWADIVSTRSLSMEREGLLASEATSLRRFIVHQVEKLEHAARLEAGDRGGRRLRRSRGNLRPRSERTSQRRTSLITGRRTSAAPKLDTTQSEWGAASDWPQVHPRVHEVPKSSQLHVSVGFGVQPPRSRRRLGISRRSIAVRVRRARARAPSLSVPAPTGATTPTEDGASVEARKAHDIGNVRVMSEDEFLKQLSRPEHAGRRAAVVETNSSNGRSQTQDPESRKRRRVRKRETRKRKKLGGRAHQLLNTPALNGAIGNNKIENNGTAGSGGFRPTPSLRQHDPTAARGVHLEEQYESQQPPETRVTDGYSGIHRFVLSSEAVQQAQIASAEQDVSWQYDLYRAPDGSRPILHYCKSKAKSEAVAQLFIDEAVLGFDLEWAPNASKKSKIKDQVSLIQLASEQRVALFQIALHDGTTAGELLAPTLKAIIESPNITKAGVAVRADCTRLERWLRVKAEGIFELSHLYKLVKFGNSTQGLVNKQLVGLSAQVLDIFGMPMRKDEVRRSLWNQSLSHAQCVYAATDAYAGYQLYRELERRRLAMRPTPPRPAFAEKDRPIELAKPLSSPQRTTSQAGHTAEPAITLPVAPSSAAALTDEAAEAESGGDAGVPKALEGVLCGMSDSKSSHMNPKLLADMEEWFTGQSWRSPRAEVQAGDETKVDLQPLLASPSQQRAYYMWHVLGMTLDEISQAQPKPIKPTTVATYIAETVRLDGAPYDKARLKTVLSMLSFGQRWRFRGIEKALH